VKEIIEVLLLLGGNKGHVRQKWFAHQLLVFLKESHLKRNLHMNTLSTSFIQGYFVVIPLFKRKTEVEFQFGKS
jgi:hypothetical protein